MARYVALAFLCAVASIAYTSRDNGISVAEKLIRDDLGLTDKQLGIVMGTFLFSYSVFQIPGAWLGQIMGSRRALTLLALVWSAATALMGLATGFVSMMSTRVIIGAAQGGLFPIAANSIAKWIPVERRAIACGSLGSFMSIGGATATALSAVLLELEWMSWRWLFVVFALPGFVWAVWFYRWFRDSPADHRSVNRAELDLISSAVKTKFAESSNASEAGTTANEDRDCGRPVPDSDAQSSGTPWGAMLTSVTMWLICMQQFFRAAGYIFYGTWFPRFLKESRGVDQMESGALASLPLLAVVVGGLVAGAVIDAVYARTGSRRLSRQGIAVAAMLMCCGLISMAYFVQDAKTAVYLITAGSFCATFAGPCAYTITIDMSGEHIPTVFGTMNTAGNLGAALCPMIVPLVVEATGSWNAVLFFFAGIYLAGAACWMLLDPERPIFQSSTVDLSGQATLG